MSEKQLLFFSDLAKQPLFPEFVNLVTMMIDQEKNIFFLEKEFDPQQLASAHAYSRGGVAKLRQLIRIIGLSEQELLRRHNGKEE